MAWQRNKPKPWQPRNLQNITKTRITNKVIKSDCNRVSVGWAEGGGER